MATLSDFSANDNVLIKASSLDLPHPQCFYAGEHGTVIEVSETYVYVNPENALSGGDRVSGVPFFPDELQILQGK